MEDAEDTVYRHVSCNHFESKQKTTQQAFYERSETNFRSSFILCIDVIVDKMKNVELYWYILIQFLSRRVDDCSEVCKNFITQVYYTKM